MDVAQLYVSFVRPTGVPVVGESVDDFFKGLIEVEKWTWTLLNEEEEERAEKEKKNYDRHDEFLKSKKTRPQDEKLLNLKHQENVAKTGKEYRAKMLAYGADASSANVVGDKTKAEALRKSMDELTKAFTEEQDKLASDLSVDLGKLRDESITDDDKLTKEQREIKRVEEDKQRVERANRSYEFSFSKRVDFATTQMLNSMKAGDVFPLATLIINQRSSNAGMFIEFTVTNLRLVDYQLRADVGETMTDMKEQWRATFRSLAYVYKNRKQIDSSGGAREGVTKVITQGTVRTFAMKKDMPF